MINNCKEIRVPIEIMNVKNLTITQKVLLSQIAGLDNKEGCFATNSYFAELFNLSKTQISSLISDLKEKRWINIKYVYKENTKCIEKRIIKVNCPPYPIILKEGIKANNNIPLKTDFKDNNKYINNKNKHLYTNYEQRDYSNFDWDSLYANLKKGDLMARSKGEGSIYYIEKRKKWSAQYTITVGGKQVRKTVYGNTKREVADKLLDLRVQMKDIDLIKEHGMSIIQIMKDIRDKKFNSNRIKEGQYTRITKTIEKIENSSLGKLNVKDISNDDIQKFLNDNKNYSNSYIKKLYEQLNQAFNFAMKNKYILQNPMDDVIKPKSTKEDKEVRALTIEEQQSLSNYLLNCTINEETYKNVFLIQMYLGLRIGETLALNINDIDIEKQIINVNKTLTLGKDNEVIMGDTTKTYASKRTVPIPDFLIPSIKEQLEVAKENKDNMLFLYNDHYISHSVANSRLKRILKSTLGMEAKDISTHSLRHTFATRCIEAGMSAVVLQRLIGHTDISITLNTYTSVFNRFKESELEKVMEYYKTNSLGLEPIKNEEIVENKEVGIEDDMEM